MLENQQYKVTVAATGAFELHSQVNKNCDTIHLGRVTFNYPIKLGRKIVWSCITSTLEKFINVGQSLSAIQTNDLQEEIWFYVLVKSN